MNDNTTLIDAAKQAMSMRVADDSDFMPTVVLDYVSGETTVVLLGIEGHPFDVLLACAKDIVTGPLSSVSLTVDTYMYKGPAEGASFGNLGVRFNNGDPDVTEALSITVAERANDRATSVHLPYVRGHDINHTPTILWGEAMEVSGEDTDGRVPALLTAMVWASDIMADLDRAEDGES